MGLQTHIRSFLEGLFAKMQTLPGSVTRIQTTEEDFVIEYGPSLLGGTDCHFSVKRKHSGKVERCIHVSEVMAYLERWEESLSSMVIESSQHSSRLYVMPRENVMAAAPTSDEEATLLTVTFDEEGKQSDELKALTIEERIKILSMEIDYELVTLHDAMQKGDQPQIYVSKRKLASLSEQKQKLNTH